MKKANKKGFTLIELIIVIAILAILIAALAPALIKYIEKSRISKDKSTLDNVYSAIKTALANEEIYGYTTSVTSGATTTLKWIKLSSLTVPTGDPATKSDSLALELFGDEATLANEYKSTTATDLQKLFKSNAAKVDATNNYVIYFAVDELGHVGVCLNKNTSPAATDVDEDTIGVIGDLALSGADW